jgi:hypothetical protein
VTSSLLIPESAKVINRPLKYVSSITYRSDNYSPGRPLARCVPTDVKNIALVFLQFRLLCRKARFVFSPALKIYFAESKLRTIVGSVSEETVLRTVVDQFILLRLQVVSV